MVIEKIPLADSGYVALIDAADAALCSGFKWRPLVNKKSDTVYAHAWHRNLHVYMHRLIAGAGPSEQVDHINRDGLDNRTVNLRLVTVQQNQANRAADRGSTSHFKGVYWAASRGKWTATIHRRRRTVYLGRYSTEEEAARAYDRAAFAEWGAYARLNFPDSVS